MIPLQAGLSAAVEDNLVPANPSARLGKFIRSDVQPQEKLDPFTREKPEDLDFRDRAVPIRRGAYKGHVSTPKNGKGRRVDMSRQLAAALQGHLSLREAEAVVAGPPASPYLFPGPNGGPLPYDWFARRWTASTTPPAATSTQPPP